MAKRTHRKKAVKRDRLALNMNSGYTLIIERPPMNVARAVMARAEKENPKPEPPTETVEAVTGVTYHIASEDGDSEDDAQLKAQREAAQAKLYTHLMDFVFEEYTSIEGYNGQDGQQKLINELAPKWDVLRKWGDVPEDMADLSEWQQALRLFIVSDMEDYSVAMFGVLKAMDVDDLDEQEARQRASFL